MELHTATMAIIHECHTTGKTFAKGVIGIVYRHNGVPVLNEAGTENWQLFCTLRSKNPEQWKQLRKELGR